MLTQDKFLRASKFRTNPDVLAKRLLKLLKDLKGITCELPVDLYEHSLQSATRAYYDGADEETIVCCLLQSI